MKVSYFNETKNFDFIDNYQQFLLKCYKEFDMSEEEKKSLKIFILDDGDEMTVENEGDFNDNKSSLNDNNELICILKSSGRKPQNKEENKEEVKDEENKDEENKEEVKDIVKKDEVSKEEIKIEKNNNKDSFNQILEEFKIIKRK